MKHIQEKLKEFRGEFYTKDGKRTAQVVTVEYLKEALEDIYQKGREDEEKRQKYLGEFEVIDGLEQHPSGLNLEQYLKGDKQ